MTHVVFEIKLEANKICAPFVNQIDQLAIALRKMIGVKGDHINVPEQTLTSWAVGYFINLYQSIGATAIPWISS
jgi:hypothetical protein